MKTIPQQSPSRGFSMIEILVVVAIMAILMVMSAPTMSAAFKGSKLSQATSDVSNFLHLAHQTAIKENKPVEVRFYKFTNPEAPIKNEALFQGYRMFIMKQKYETTGGDEDVIEAVAEGPVKRMPNGTYMTDAGEMSTLLGNVVTSESEEGVRGLIAGQRIKAEYRSFVFRPDGTANLPVDSKWFVTVISMEEKQKNREQKPDNYSCLMINPANGEIRPFSP
jgi:uncharacterized protein (TIGR02596 family)